MGGTGVDSFKAGFGFMLSKVGEARDKASAAVSEASGKATAAVGEAREKAAKAVGEARDKIQPIRKKLVRAAATGYSM
ncbi:hypothetical protein T484DRAFT_1858941 [Baffinella frigidus]|nr:hypothetical protein T484DRAFT_1858941 [Cryptophyta sp. CCMP2293]